MAKTLKIREDVNTDSDMKNILAKFGAIKQRVETVTEDALDIEEVNTPPVVFNPPVVEMPPISIDPPDEIAFPPADLPEIENDKADSDLPEVKNHPAGNSHPGVLKQPVDLKPLGGLILPVVFNPPGVKNPPVVKNLPEENSEKSHGSENTPGGYFTPSLTEDDLFVQCGSVTNYGYYCLLRRKIIENDGVIHINAFCKYYNCDKKILLAVIKRLEDKELLHTISSGQEGRRFALGGRKKD
jgi:hypothetical protein